MWTRKLNTFAAWPVFLWLPSPGRI